MVMSSMKWDRLRSLVDVKEKRRARLTEYAAEKATATYLKVLYGLTLETMTLRFHVRLKTEINGEAAKRLVAQGVICVSEGANMPKRP